MKQGVVSLVLALLLACVVGCGQPAVITLEEYNTIPEKASYQQVVKIVGAEGVQTKSSQMPMPFGDGTEMWTVTEYTWTNPDKSTAAMTFSNDELMGKTHDGLK